MDLKCVLLCNCVESTTISKYMYSPSTITHYMGFVKMFNCSIYIFLKNRDYNLSKKMHNLRHVKRKQTNKNTKILKQILLSLATLDKSMQCEKK